MASQGAIWGPAALRFLRVAVTKTSKVVRNRLADVARPFEGQVQAIPVRSGYAGRQPIHPAALLKQQKNGARWISSVTAQSVNNVVRRFISSGRTPATRPNRSPTASNTSRRVAQFSGRAPFASTLRPNLTGGAMPRTAGGYSLGGGARYFSHAPAAQAQVVQNVSQAMRAFFLSGQKIRYDGLGPRGDRRYRAVSSLEDNTMNKLSALPRSTLGSYIDFQISPTITALSPIAAAITGASQKTCAFAGEVTAPTSLDTEGFLDVLAVDFGRALKDLTAISTDLRRLSALGALPVSMEGSGTIRVRFPGVDAHTVEQLCDDIGIQRGIVGQDAGFDAAGGVPMALLFPFAPETERAVSSPGGSARSLTGHEIADLESSLDDDSFVRDAFANEVADNMSWLSDTQDFQSTAPPHSSGERNSEEFEGLEGIYRFMAACDEARGRLG